MLNILVPLAGRSAFFSSDHYQYPTPLIEIADKPMIERVIDNLSAIKQSKRFIFILNDEDCRKYHLDDVIRLLVKENVEIIRLMYPTLGAACSCLMAVKFINNEDPLLISNGDQVIHTDLDALFELQQLRDHEARVYCIRSVHPRWSYVGCDENGNVLEVAEKRPISNQAIAGIYLFERGNDFVEAAMKMIYKGDSVDARYFIAPALNQHILDAKPATAVNLDQSVYHSLYTPERVTEYEEYLSKS